MTGGAPSTLRRCADHRGGAWSEDDTIVFSPDQTSGTRLLRVSSSGGKAEPLASLADGEVIQVWPQVLPGGKAVLYTGSGVPRRLQRREHHGAAITGRRRGRSSSRGGYHGRYLPTGSAAPRRASGHLVYIHDGTLFAAPFDLDGSR